MMLRQLCSYKNTGRILALLLAVTILSGMVPGAVVSAQTTTGSPVINLYRENGTIYRELQSGGTAFTQDVTVVLFTSPTCTNTGAVMRDVCGLNSKGSSVKVILAYTSTPDNTAQIANMRQKYPDADVIPYSSQNAIAASNLAKATGISSSGSYTTPLVAIIPNKNNAVKAVKDVFTGYDSGIRAAIRKYTGGQGVIDVTGIQMTWLGEAINLKSSNLTKQYQASVVPANATYPGITYTSSDPSVASVNSSGLVTAHKAGTVSITATSADGGFTTSANLRVVENYIYVNYLDMDTWKTIELTVGGTQTLNYFVSPSNATDRSVTITSSNPSVATVDAAGLITGKSAGEAQITVTTNDTDASGNRLSKSMKVKVTGSSSSGGSSSDGGSTGGNAGGSSSSGSGTTTGSWKKSGTKWWYQYANGGYPRNEWLKVDGKWYHFDSYGYMQTGWIKVGSNWYYLNGSGAMLTGWQKIGGKWYYLKSSGAMATGWVKDGSKWYYLNASGAMQTGWIKLSGKWYYMNTSGAMQTGWVKLGGKWYYLDSSGAMLANTSRRIGSKTYRFNAGGVCLNP